MSEKSITLYALSTCIHCKKAKEYLDDCGTKYNCVFVDKLEGEERKETIALLKKVNPSLSFPTLQVDDEAIVGFKEAKFKAALEKS